MTLFQRAVQQIAALWLRRSLGTRLAVCVTVFLAVARRVLWLFSTPHTRAEIPRAVAVLNLEIAASYLELASLCLPLRLPGHWKSGGVSDSNTMYDETGPVVRAMIDFNLSDATSIFQLFGGR